MSRIPALSLFARSFALLSALMLASVLGWVGAYTYFEREPRSAQLAQWVATTVNTVRPALLNANVDRRIDLLFDLKRRENIRIYPADPTDLISPLPDSALMQRLTTKLRATLGPDTRLASSVDGTEGFWVSFNLELGDEYWLRLPMEHIEPKTERTWLGWAMLSLLLALGGAWALVAHFTRPLSRLAQAAQAVAHGSKLPPLPDNGPPEIASVTRAFNHMSQSLRQVEDDRALSLAGVSHDLRTPLARLRLEIELAGVEDTTRQSMEQDINEMDAIVGQFIDFARGVDDELPVEIDLTRLIDEHAESFALRGAIVEWDSTELPLLMGKSLALRRMIGNLLHNALRYGGEHNPITVEARFDDDQIEIDIADRGPGIAEDQRDRLRRAFIRGNQARTGAQGAGLGLAIVERIAIAHGGHLQLLSREGGGLVARVSLSRSLCI